MSNATLEKVLEEAKSLPANEQRQLRAALEQTARTAELRRIQSKYKHLPMSSESFAASKADEIALEDRLGGK